MNKVHSVRTKITTVTVLCFAVGMLGILLALFFYAVAAPQSETNAAYIRLLVFVLAFFIFVGLVTAIAVNRTTAKAVRPLHMMLDFLKQVGETGNLRFTDDDWKKIRGAAALNNEIGQSLAAFAKMLEQWIYYDKTLRAVAARDLTVEVKPLGDGDTIGTALRAMIENLGGIFAEIQVSASQVSDGSRQIADGSQSLAQGTGEQADSVERLSASIAEVSHSIVKVSDSAKNLSDLAGVIKEKAEQGTGQMNEMMEAVHAISEASQRISGVIKIIDDIAFQTNILALNAAVEAARAGQYGKGFAVVAEEVRNLAAKSAEAAKNTGSLIENSVLKADLGVKIAARTNESLGEIVDGVIRSGEIIDEIATDTNRQSDAIAQIDANVTQITYVVQQNSATAEESAAASEALSGQSETLNALLDRFTLKDIPETRLPPPAARRQIPPATAARPRAFLHAETAAPAPRAAAPAVSPAFTRPETASVPVPTPTPTPAPAPAGKYVWTPDLETGHDLIDSQHRQLIQALASLVEACSSGHGRAALEETLDFLESYTAMHFADEEALQKEYEYPDYPNHKKLHDGFKRVVADLSRQLKTEGATIVLVGKVNTHIGGWLVKHIKGEDTKVAAHLRRLS